MAQKNTGDTIIFGSYEQDNKASTGEESIEWIVLSNNGRELFVVSKYSLDYRPYHKKQSEDDVTWEACSLRQWLNDDFYSEAFSNSERDMIMSTAIKNNDHPETHAYGQDTMLDGGNDTVDKVFLLSLNDVLNTSYGFSNDYSYNPNESRLCAPTDYAVAKGAYVDRKEDLLIDGLAPAAWWLRSPSISTACSTVVSHDGACFGAEYKMYNICVRPAIVIKYSD